MVMSALTKTSAFSMVPSELTEAALLKKKLSGDAEFQAVAVEHLHGIQCDIRRLSKPCKIPFALFVLLDEFRFLSGHQPNFQFPFSDLFRRHCRDRPQIRASWRQGSHRLDFLL